MTLATFGSAGLAALLVGLGLFFAANTDHALARYPGSWRVGEERFDLLSGYEGHVGEASVYRTYDDVVDVSRWYRSDQGFVQSDSGFSPRTECLNMSRIHQLGFIRRTIRARLCSMPYGTLVSVNQTISLWR